MPLNVIPENEVEKIDNRNTKKKYLETDSICLECGAILNSYYEDKCTICSCSGTDFVSGKVGIDIRTYLGFHIEDLIGMCEINGIGTGTRAKMVLGLIKKFHSNSCAIRDKRINEFFIRKIITRNKKKFWFLVDIENEMCKIRTSKFMKEKTLSVGFKHMIIVQKEDVLYD